MTLTDRATARAISRTTTRLSNSIVRKWKEQGCFVQWIDGDRSNNALSNLRWMSLQGALEHIDDWQCDWDIHLTEKEIALVKSEAWRSELRFD
jgi:hypothetical protein